MKSPGWVESCQALVYSEVHSGLATVTVTPDSPEKYKPDLLQTEIQAACTGSPPT